MKKLHTFAFYALATPILTFGAGSALAQQSADQDIYGQEESANQSTYGQEESANQNTYGQEESANQDSADQDLYGQEEYSDQDSADQELYGQEDSIDQGAEHSSPVVTEGDQSIDAGEYDSQAAVESENSSSDQSKSSQKNRGFLSSAPTNGMHANNLIGAEVKTSADENVGPVTDLIIDDENHIVAIVVSVGGFLGMGDREVAIGWDDVTKSGDSDDLELQIDATREDLSAAPEFEKQD